MTPSEPAAAPFGRVPPGVDFPAQEARILKLWDEMDAFQRSIELRPSEREYTFYDGPPFATGSPHYGHILAGIIKDIVPRYWTMRGHRIERRFGWDTHGLPVEMEVEKQLGVSGPRQIVELGVDRFNEACRRMVETTTGDWEEITRRIGRWVDFRNDYRTMDVDFMESVWWVFRSLWDKSLVYQDFKVLPYSYGAATPLSNFEANMDYRQVQDPAITVRLPVTASAGPAEAGDDLLIWTTTPWTLPGNLAVAVGEDISYRRVQGTLGGRPGVYWLAAGLMERFFPQGAEILAEVPGSELLGTEYEPAFQYFAEERDRGAFRIIPSPDVDMEEGTGLVHMAPAYGEADFYALQAAGLDVLVDPIDATAHFTEDVADVAGMHVKEADAKLIELLDQSGLLLAHETITHAYPFCWRTETPLIFKAIPTWFVRVEEFRDRMVVLNKQIHWVPEHVGTRRFGNWLEGARDWAISRNRYWGSCIPVWECDSCKEQVCVGSIDELEERSGVRPHDLHKHVVDQITFPCQACQGSMRRVPEVLDCWFESGSMPYAQNHYPFENADAFDHRFPADFISEGLDQTRAWFYTLHVLSTALFDTVPFDNCVVFGLILAADGRKMSKSLKNYPDPAHVLDDYGADALRAYLINSTLLRAEPHRFKESGVRDVVRKVMLPLWNAYSFFTTYAEADGISRSTLREAPPSADRPEIDRWILSVLQSLIDEVNKQMEGYYLYAVIPRMLEFVEDLTNWYIRRSRRRFWRQRTAADADKLAAFATLYEVLVTFSQVMAPVLPFVTETMFQDLVVHRRSPGEEGPVSIHHCDYPEARQDLVDRQLEGEIEVVRAVVNMGRRLRAQHGLKVRQPLPRMTVVTADAAIASAVSSHADLIGDELNVKQLETSSDERPHLHLRAKANFRVLGPRLGERMREAAAGIERLSEDSIASLLEGESLTIAGEQLTAEDVIVVRDPREGIVVASDGAISVALDSSLTPDLITEGLAREIVNRIQGLRRREDLEVTDRISLTWWSENDRVRDAFAEHGEFIAGEILAVDLVEASASGLKRTLEVDGAVLEVDLETTGPVGPS